MSKTKEIEIWKSLNFMGYPDYEISTLGRVKSLERTIIRKNGRKNTYPERILKPSKNKFGYLVVGLHKDGKLKNFTVHRLVCLAFLENPNNLPQINHKDENKENNHVDNLEFCTAKHNTNYGTRNERASKNISKVMKGKKHSEETKQKISDSKKGENNPMFGKISPNRKPILQFTKDMVFVREFDSATTASKELKLSQGNITACCKRRQKTCSGFIWKYKE